MTLPDFLAPFRDELESFKRECVRIEPKEVYPDPSYYEKYCVERSVLGLCDSKFLGKPYWPASIEYPRRASDGQPMMMLAQINFSEVPPLEDFPRTGLLQLFACAHRRDYSQWGCDGNHRIVFHENIEENHMNDFSFLTIDLDWSPIITEAELGFKKCLEYGGIRDASFTFSRSHDPVAGRYDYEIYEEFFKKFTREQQLLINELLGGRGEKIGGYSDFAQRDPRGRGGDIQVLQFDGFADSFHCGTGHIFMPLQALRERDFSKAYLHHDNT